MLSAVKPPDFEMAFTFDSCKNNHKNNNTTNTGFMVIFVSQLLANWFRTEKCCRVSPLSFTSRIHCQTGITGMQATLLFLQWLKIVFYILNVLTKLFTLERKEIFISFMLNGKYSLSSGQTFAAKKFCRSLFTKFRSWTERLRLSTIDLGTIQIKAEIPEIATDIPNRLLWKSDFYKRKLNARKKF